MQSGDRERHLALRRQCCADAACDSPRSIVSRRADVAPAGA
jgi:hypothetical protein